MLFTCRVPSLWAQVEVEAGKCRVESGIIEVAKTRCEGLQGQDQGDHKRRKRAHADGDSQTIPDAAEIAAAAAVVYQAVLEQVVHI